MPTGLLSFPGIELVRSWSFTLSHGITPGVAHVEIAPQFDVPAEIGTMTISFGDVELDFPGCVLDSALVRRDRAGMVVHLAILDRRWAWRYGAISGRYNVRQRDGSLDTSTEMAPQDLAALLLSAMGESNFDASGLPNLARPEVDWVYANPAQELAELAESLGCRVVLDLDSRVVLAPAGYGAELPGTGTERTQNFGIDPPTRPDSLLLVGGPTRFQTMFRLEAVGLDTNGKIQPINTLSYMPKEGWTSEAYLGFANVTPADSRALARRTVYRWYRIKCTAPFATEGQFQIAGYDGPVQGLWQLLPLEHGQVATYTDVDGIERPLPPDVAGIYWDRSLDANNIPAQRRYRGRFSLDAARGIVRFAEPVVQVNSGGTSFAEAQLYLTVAHGVKGLASLQEFRRTSERDLPGEPNGTGPHIVRRDDLVQTVITEYDSGNNPTGTTDNAGDFDAEAQGALDAAEAGFQTLETGVVEYAGVVPISPDGAIQQVEWSGGLAGCVTRASRNSEFSLVVPPFPERRQAERRRDQPRVSPASAAALREVRERKGGR
jgi:hypothetical protein